MTAPPDAPRYRLVRPQRLTAPPPELDDAQRRVVEHRGGPLLVLAGPGTGKTTTLVEAAVARVEAGVSVDDILMLTFSRRAAGELRDRVTARLGRTIREPIARTLHSYAFGVLRMANVAQKLPAPRLLSGPEQDVVIRELLAESKTKWPTSLLPALRTRAFAGELRDLMMRAVERGLDGPRLAELGLERGRDDWVAAGQFLAEYHGVTALLSPGAYDPAELIRSAVNALAGDDGLLLAERTRRQHIFVDEYQDTDPAQAELLSLLAPGRRELVLVGDPDQSIYAFRGADERALRDVEDRFGPNVPVVPLQVSRRAGPTLLGATRRVAARLPGRAEHRDLVAAAELPGSVEVGLFRTASEEAGYIASMLRAAHLDGMPWSRMAVLVRSTTTVLGALRRGLIAAGVPVTVRGEDLPLPEQPAVAMLLEVLACVQNPNALTEDVAERLLLGPIGGADIVSLRRLRRVLKSAEPDQPPLLAPVLHDRPGAELLPDRVRRPVLRVARTLAAGRDATRDGTPEDVLWAVWDASGLARRWLQASSVSGAAGAAADRDLDAVVHLFETAARYVDRLPRGSLRGFTEHLAAQQIPGDSMATSREQADAVTILTAHASKGLEWDLVCVAHVQEGSWPDLRKRGTLLGSEQLVDLVAGYDTAAATHSGPTRQLAEERRLFYVATTRARQRLIVTAVSAEDEQPSRFLDEIDPVDDVRPLALARRGTHLPALVAELRAVACDASATVEDRAAAAAELARLAGAGVRGADPDEWWGLAAVSDDGPPVDPDRPVPISPSRIDSFLRCEVRSVLQDLGARDGDSISQNLGTLVHEVAAALSADATQAEFEAALDERWHSLDFAAQWYADNERERAGRILEVLRGWVVASRAEGLELIAIEEDFATELDDAQLRGRVDRLERDAAGRLVVVDLKTGKRRVSPDDMPTHLQLAAYQLAVEQGAFGVGQQSGGARLVQLAATGKDPEQRQEPLSESDDPQWIRSAIEDIAQRLRGTQFLAIENGYCSNCDLATCCPLFPSGRQVTT